MPLTRGAISLFEERKSISSLAMCPEKILEIKYN
jgi:hypothetical protein